MSDQTRRGSSVSVAGNSRGRWLNDFFMHASDPIVVGDLDGNITDLNLEAETSYGWTRGELVGRHMRTIVAEDCHEQGDDLLRRCKAGEIVRNVESVRRDRSGQEFPVLLTVSLLRNDQGRPIGLASIAKDITEQKRIQAELRVLSRVFMDAADPILIQDLEGRIIDMNPEAERAYGWSRDRLIGKPLLVIVPIESHDQAMELVRRCTAGEYVRNADSQRQTMDGGVREVLLTLSLLRDEHGQPTGIASLAKDVTTLKAAEKKLRSLSKVFMDAGDPIVIEDLNGNVIEMNPEAEQVYGWSREELLHRPIRTLVPPERHTRAMEMLALCKAGESVRNVEGVRQTKSGEKIPVLLTLSLLRADGGQAVGIASIAKDLSEQKAAQRELREYRDHLEDLVADRTADLEVANERLADAKQAAEDANRAKSTFLANMNHELRTPLNSILGYSEVLQEDAQEQKLDQFASDLERINGAGRHLLALINDVLDLSKIEAGKMELHLESFTLEDLIADVSATVQPLVERKRNTLEIDCEPGGGPVTADMTKLRQSLFNLISNAAKFTEDGRITVSVRRSQDEGREWVSYAVADTGIGIPADRIDGMFDEFSQVDTEISHRFGGTGLGLTITRRFCEMMGGDISVESKLGEGTTITLRMPSEVTGPAGIESMPERPLPEGPCVLVIDDDPNACDLICRTLEDAGHQVAVATSGADGLRLARELAVQLITLDVLMPGKDGWATLKELKADPALRDIPVIMISIVDDHEMGYALGATDFISKPIDRGHLRQLLGRYGIDPRVGLVLVVDDDDNVRRLMRRLLEAEGFRVADAGNGQEALEQVRAEAPDMIILDLTMPVMDGFQFATELRAVEAWNRIPVVVSTARDLNSRERAALSGKVASIMDKEAGGMSALMAQVHAFVDEPGEAPPTES